MTQDTTSLIEKLEGAEVGSRELDCRVVAWGEGVIGGEHWSDGDLAYALTDPDRTCNPAPVTTSLDAALALVERVVPGVWWIAGRGKLRASEAEYGAQLMFGEEPIGQGEGATAALALCAALLRAQSEAR